MSATERTPLSPSLASASSGGKDSGSGSSGGGGGGGGGLRCSSRVCGRCLAGSGEVCTRGVRSGCAGFWGPAAVLAGLRLVFIGAPGDRPWFNAFLLLTRPSC